MDAENNLHTVLFNQSRYNKRIRPGNPVTVSARYNLQYLNSVNVKSQTMSTTGWFNLFWFDSRLEWEPSSYGGIEDIYVSEDLVWHPNLIVLNSILELEKNFGAERIIRIFYFGVLRWEPIAILSTSCVMVVAFFPFDVQRCYIELASLDLPSTAVNLTFLHTPINKGVHTPQGDWELKRTEHRSTGLMAGSVKYSLLKFGLVVKRLPGHYFMIVIFPNIITAVLSFATFFLPLKSGVRIGYILTVVLALVVLLTLFADTLPSSSKYPSVLVVLFTITLGMAFLLVIITIYVMGLYNKPKHNIAPKWMHSMVRKIRKFKLKLKCRARTVNPLEQHKSIEDGRPTEEIDSVEKCKPLKAEGDEPCTALKPDSVKKCRPLKPDSIEECTPLKPFSNKELAEFFDSFLFIAYTTLYIVLLAGIPIVATIWYKLANEK
ncbi:CHRNA6 [Mytilus edulis]|uniref:CHRNA6 n=1 Tax=Mytilus edulis TaxID=6550 RepID=A0A8S3RKW3_MYTED|nr:CHRNA6 [Mytilus edulis]